MKISRRFIALLAGAVLALLPLPAQPTTETPGQPATARSGDGVDDERPARPAVADEPPGGRGGQVGAHPGGIGHQPGSRCRPGTPPDAPPTTAYLDDNPIFGPADLPAAHPVQPLLAGYQRFGALGEAQFLAQYATPTLDAYVYPPAFGFVVGPDGRPIKAAQQLLPGYRLDRFGFPGGVFLAPLGTPFSARSLPPSNLNTPQRAPLSNYRTYCVLKPFTVDAGPIAPWFAQPGMGTQFKLEPKYLPQAGSKLSITWLLEHGYLAEEHLVARGNPRCATAGATAC